MLAVVKEELCDSCMIGMTLLVVVVAETYVLLVVLS